MKIIIKFEILCNIIFIIQKKYLLVFGWIPFYSKIMWLSNSVIRLKFNWRVQDISK